MMREIKDRQNDQDHIPDSFALIILSIIVVLFLIIKLRVIFFFGRRVIINLHYVIDNVFAFLMKGLTWW